MVSRIPTRPYIRRSSRRSHEARTAVILQPISVRTQVVHEVFHERPPFIPGFVGNCVVWLRQMVIQLIAEHEMVLASIANLYRSTTRGRDVFGHSEIHRVLCPSSARCSRMENVGQDMYTKCTGQEQDIDTLLRRRASKEARSLDAFGHCADVHFYAFPLTLQCRRTWDKTT